MYETLHFTAKASVQNSTQGTRWDPDLVKTLGTTVGRLPPGLVADPGPSSYSGPRHSTGWLPLPQRHKKRTPEEHVDQRKDGESCWAVTWWRRWSRNSRARVQAAGAVTQPALPTLGLLERHRPLQPVPTTHTYWPHSAAPESHKQDRGLHLSSSQSLDLPEQDPKA